MKSEMLKRTAPILIILAALVSSCKYDDTEIRTILEDHADRLGRLESLCSQMNSDIATLKTLLSADFIEGCTPVEENGKVIGYTITFAKGGKISIYNGSDGASGNTPVVGAAKYIDGLYYWTLNGEWIMADGNMVPASGKDGAPGADGNTPQLKIEEGYWYISYDNGATWNKLVDASGSSMAGGIFAGVDTSSGNEAVFTLNGGGSFSVPIKQSFRLGADGLNGLYSFIGSVTLDMILPSGLQESNFSALRASITVADGTAQDIYTKAVSTSRSDWTVTITPPTFTNGKCNGDAAVTVVYNGSGVDVTAMLEAVLVWTDGSVSQTMRPISASADGSNPVLARSEYGAYPAFGASTIYQAGESQIICEYEGSSVVFTIYSATNSAVEMSGIPQDAATGSRFTLVTDYYEGLVRTSGSTYEVEVLKEEGPKLWLATEAGDGFIIRK